MQQIWQQLGNILETIPAQVSLRRGNVGSGLLPATRGYSDFGFSDCPNQSVENLAKKGVLAGLNLSDRHQLKI